MLRTPKIVLISRGQVAARKMSTIAGLSPMPKNRSAIGIRLIDGTERKIWIDQSANTSSI
jgi:hypothetical protein